MPFYRRADLQAIAQAKLDDALLLLAHGRFANAYCLAGYAVEIGLKACIARQITTDVIPDRALINDTYRHDLLKLIGAAGLEQSLKAAEQNDPAFAVNWAVVRRWSPEIRYENTNQARAQLMLAAISDQNAGVLSWIKRYW